MTDAEIDRLAQGLAAGQRRALARAITLAESTRPDHRAAARALLRRAAPQGQTLRIGLSGTPGVGKSSFIEAFGMARLAQGRRLAVLAVDPSSSISGGSILGDKTRMEKLSREDAAFIRPSPAGATLGGVARRTREAIALSEAGGHDLVLVETVGVGQSEAMAAEMTDIFVLLIGPGGGDELQGVKRGIMEIADIILVNKADGDLERAARRTVADYSGALRLMRRRPGDPEDFPKAMPVSALTGAGLDAAWAEMTRLAEARRAGGALEKRRRDQARLWFRRELEAGFVAALQADPRAADALPALEDAVATGRRGAEEAAAEALALLLAR